MRKLKKAFDLLIISVVEAKSLVSFIEQVTSDLFAFNSMGFG